MDVADLKSSASQLPEIPSGCKAGTLRRTDLGPNLGSLRHLEILLVLAVA